MDKTGTKGVVNCMNMNTIIWFSCGITRKLYSISKIKCIMNCLIGANWYEYYNNIMISFISKFRLVSLLPKSQNMAFGYISLIVFGKYIAKSCSKPSFEQLERDH